MIASIIDDPVQLVLAVGVVASIVSAMAYVSGRTTARSKTGGRAAKGKPSPAVGAPARSPLDAVTASSALFRANAAARARSSATVPKPAPRGYTLEHVRPLPVARVDAGQKPLAADGPEQDRVEATQLASAIAFHIAEHDPQRMAEVITQWIRSDQKRTNGSL